MKYIKLFLFLIVSINAQSALAMTIESDNNSVPELITEFGKTGTVSGVDPEGQWISINSKKYILNGTGSIDPKNLRSGLRVHFNVEKEKGERNGRVTRMWIEKKK
ncbi:MAG: hypothetical protein V3U84_03205 [Thiotrichaceae bacterium]